MGGAYARRHERWGRWRPCTYDAHTLASTVIWEDGGTDGRAMEEGRACTGGEGRRNAEWSEALAGGGTGQGGGRKTGPCPRGAEPERDGPASASAGPGQDAFGVRSRPPQLPPSPQGLCITHPCSLTAPAAHQGTVVPVDTSVLDSTSFKYLTQHLSCCKMYKEEVVPIAFQWPDTSVWWRNSEDPGPEVALSRYSLRNGLCEPTTIKEHAGPHV